MTIEDIEATRFAKVCLHSATPTRLYGSTYRSKAFTLSYMVITASMTALLRLRYSYVARL